MRIERTTEGYKASHKLPDGFTVVGTGYTVESALMWALWGVKSFYARQERARKAIKKGFGRILSKVHA